MRGNITADSNGDENVSLAGSSFNVGGAIAAAAFLLLVLGLPSYLHTSPV